MTLVVLTENELAVVDFAGRRAWQRTEGRGARNRLAGRTQPVEERIDSTGAELAASKYLNLYPRFLEGREAAADVGWHYQVRSTRHVNGHLIAHPEDPLDHRFVLVIVLGEGRFDVRGTIFGRKAERYGSKLDEWGHRGYWIPQAYLDPPKGDL